MTSTPPPLPSPALHKRSHSESTATSSPKRSKMATPPCDIHEDHTLKTMPESTDNPSTTSPPSPLPPTHLTLTYHHGDIFTCPSHTLLIHACNTQGSWGAGIALAFKTHYPSAFKTYRSYCLTAKPSRGTALLIPTNQDHGHWVGCLFTSAKYGRAKDPKDMILRNTGPAMRELLQSVKAKEREGETIGVIRMCKINSGKFGVEWEETEKVLQEIVVEDGWRGEIEVWEP